MTPTFKLDGARLNPDAGDLGEFFGTMADHLREAFLREGLSEQLTAKVTYDVILELSKAFAGEMIYVSNKPKEIARRMGAYADLQYMPSHLVDRKWAFSRGYSLKIAQQIRERKQAREQLRLKGI